MSYALYNVESKRKVCVEGFIQFICVWSVLFASVSDHLYCSSKMILLLIGLILHHHIVLLQHPWVLSLSLTTLIGREFPSDSRNFLQIIFPLLKTPPLAVEAP